MRKLLAAGICAGSGAGAWLMLATGRLTLDFGVGRRTRPLGPISRRIAAPPELIFDLIAAPYLGRTPRALAGKLEVLERSSEMALAAHYTQAGRIRTTTLETVRFERPHLVSFRLVRGPVPHVFETYELASADDGSATDFLYSGELGTDGWTLGAWWGDRVALPWERTVGQSLEQIAAEAERLAGRGAR